MKKLFNSRAEAIDALMDSKEDLPEPEYDNDNQLMFYTNMYEHSDNTIWDCPEDQLPDSDDLNFKGWLDLENVLTTNIEAESRNLEEATEALNNGLKPKRTYEDEITRREARLEVLWSLQRAIIEDRILRRKLELLANGEAID